MDRLPPGSHGGTYGGNVVACAAALATLDVIEDEGLVANARARGAQLLDGLRRRPRAGRAVGDVRGLGLMVALELVRPGEGDGTGAGSRADQADPGEACFDRVPAGPDRRHVRQRDPDHPAPGDHGRSEVEQALGIVAEALDAAGA